MAPKVRPQQSSDDEFDPDNENSETIPQIYPPRNPNTVIPDIDLDIISLPGQSKKSLTSQASRRSQNSKSSRKYRDHRDGGHNSAKPSGNAGVNNAGAPQNASNAASSQPNANRRMSNWSGSSNTIIGVPLYICALECLENY
jgi:hypothetical protein